MEFYTRTDLACESMGRSLKSEEGVEHRVERLGSFRMHRTEVCTEQASQRLGKPQGTYLTVECGNLQIMIREEREALADLLAEEMKHMAERLSGKSVGPNFSVFVAGLGNAELTADAIGPKTVQKLTATRHLCEHEGVLFQGLGCSLLSALAPGVLGQTGIETLELLRGAVDHVCPDVVLVIDALAARSCERLATTVQLSDVGIAPGSGVGNHRSAITRETLGLPVLALGVPTVVNSATLVYDALCSAGLEGRIDESLRRVLETGKSFFVSPKESDVITESFSDLLAESISIAFMGALHQSLR
ncbi:MAG: GPR endopeptidase [Clostridia bacterium]|nr:GPR endopeptidase [Clostridia bacterium]